MKCLACALVLVSVVAPLVLVPSAGAGQQTEGLEQSVTVDPRERWTDTGLDIQREDGLTFEVSGQVQLSEDPADVAVPAGSTAGRLAPEAPLRGQLAGALIGRLGTGPAFGIGDQASLRAPQTGRLYLSVNDDHLADNTGAFRVRIRLERSRTLPQGPAPRATSGAKGPSLLERLQRVLTPTTGAPVSGEALLPCPIDVNVRWDNCYGALTLGDGRRVVGDWHDDKLNGRALYVWPDGRVYLGEFVNDQRQGRGTLYGPTGTVENAGQWENDRFVRAGGGAVPPCPPDPNVRWDGCFSRVTMQDGARYTGEWRGDAVAGVGMYTYPDGQTYLGEFAANQRHGRGTLYTADGRVTSAGRWQNDVLVDSVALPPTTPSLASGGAAAGKRPLGSAGGSALPMPGPPPVPALDSSPYPPGMGLPYPPQATTSYPAQTPYPGPPYVTGQAPAYDGAVPGSMGAPSPYSPPVTASYPAQTPYSGAPQYGTGPTTSYGIPPNATTYPQPFPPPDLNASGASPYPPYPGGGGPVPDSMVGLPQSGAVSGAPTAGDPYGMVPLPSFGSVPMPSTQTGGAGYLPPSAPANSPPAVVGLPSGPPPGNPVGYRSSSALPQTAGVILPGGLWVCTMGSNPMFTTRYTMTVAGATYVLAGGPLGGFERGTNWTRYGGQPVSFSTGGWRGFVGEYLPKGSLDVNRIPTAEHKLWLRPSDASSYSVNCSMN